MWRPIIVCTALSLWMVPPVVAAETGPDRHAASTILMQGLQKHLLEKEHLVPLGIFSDAELGDTLSLADDRVVARGSDCFKDLAADRKPHPVISEHSGSALNISAALGLAGVADASVGATRIKNYDLSFTDVQTAYVTIIQLRRARTGNDPECRRLEPFLTGDYVANVGERPPVIVGRLLYARRHIRIEFSDSASAEVETKGMLARLHGLLTLHAAINASQQNVVELVAEQSSPIAFQQALIEVERTVGAQMGAGSQHTVIESHVEEFNPDLPSHAAAWQAWLDGSP